MTTYIACSRYASDAELVSILAEAAKSEDRTRWCCVEGPTRCAFVGSAEVTRHAIQAATLWQVRLFAEEVEIAARRRHFQADQAWMVRWIAPALPGDRSWSEPVHLPPGKLQRLLLYGQADVTGHFRGGRFRRAMLQYPGDNWQEGDQAELIIETHDLDDGAIVRWKHIAKYVPALEVSDHARQ